MATKPMTDAEFQDSISAYSADQRRRAFDKAAKAVEGLSSITKDDINGLIIESLQKEPKEAAIKAAFPNLPEPMSSVDRRMGGSFLKASTRLMRQQAADKGLAAADAIAEKNAVAQQRTDFENRLAEFKAGRAAGTISEPNFENWMRDERAGPGKTGKTGLIPRYMNRINDIAEQRTSDLGGDSKILQFGALPAIAKARDIARNALFHGDQSVADMKKDDLFRAYQSIVAPKDPRSGMEQFHGTVRELKATPLLDIAKGVGEGLLDGRNTGTDALTMAAGLGARGLAGKVIESAAKSGKSASAAARLISAGRRAVAPVTDLTANAVTSAFPGGDFSAPDAAIGGLMGLGIGAGTELTFGAIRPIVKAAKDAAPSWIRHFANRQGPAGLNAAFLEAISDDIRFKPNEPVGKAHLESAKNVIQDPAKVEKLRELTPDYNFQGQDLEYEVAHRLDALVKGEAQAAADAANGAKPKKEKKLTPEKVIELKSNIPDEGSERAYFSGGTPAQQMAKLRKAVNSYHTLRAYGEHDLDPRFEGTTAATLQGRKAAELEAAKAGEVERNASLQKAVQEAQGVERIRLEEEKKASDAKIAETQASLDRLNAEVAFNSKRSDIYTGMNLAAIADKSLPGSAMAAIKKLDPTDLRIMFSDDEISGPVEQHLIDALGEERHAALKDAARSAATDETFKQGVDQLLKASEAERKASATAPAPLAAEPTSGSTEAGAMAGSEGGDAQIKAAAAEREAVRTLAGDPEKAGKYLYEKLMENPHLLDEIDPSISDAAITAAGGDKALAKSSKEFIDAKIPDLLVKLRQGRLPKSFFQPSF